MSPNGHLAAPDECDGTSAVGESRHRIPDVSVGQPTEPCLAPAGADFAELLFVIVVSSDYSHSLRLRVSVARDMLCVVNTTTVPANDSLPYLPTSAVLSTQDFSLGSGRRG
jgi:hypothetical protein